MAQKVNFSMNVNVLVRGEKRSRELAYTATQVENITDAVKTLQENFVATIADREQRKLAALTLEKTNSKGETEKYVAGPQDLAADYIVQAINKQLRLDVSQPLNTVVREELYGPERQIEKLAGDIFDRRKKAGKEVTMAWATEKAREAFE
jgi:hypothetical protein